MPCLACNRRSWNPDMSLGDEGGDTAADLFSPRHALRVLGLRQIEDDQRWGSWDLQAVNGILHAFGSRPGPLPRIICYETRAADDVCELDTETLVLDTHVN